MENDTRVFQIIYDVCLKRIESLIEEGRVKEIREHTIILEYLNAQINNEINLVD